MAKIYKTANIKWVETGRSTNIRQFMLNFNTLTYVMYESVKIVILVRYPTNAYVCTIVDMHIQDPCDSIF